MPASPEPLISFESLPFQIGSTATPHNERFPDHLPFALGVDPRTGLLMQTPNPEVTAILEQVYADGSMIGTPMRGEGVGRRYADDFLAFFESVCGSRREGHLLEVGCGTGYLLHRLRELGFDVLGFEPGPQAQELAREHGIRIVQDIFPGSGADRARSEYDFIVHFGVLEHVEDPVAFLRAQADHLGPEGQLVLAVPDCAPYIATGDISMLVHEHWSYFSPASLEGVLAHSGLRLRRLEAAGFGGMTYAVATREDRGSERARLVEARPDEAYSFLEWVDWVEECFASYLEGARAAGRSVGLYCPGRAINILHTIGASAGIRFFDDDTNLHGRYYPPFEVPVEPRSSLIETPVDELLIMSRSFGEKIRASLRNEGPLDAVEIALFEEIIDPARGQHHARR